MRRRNFDEKRLIVGLIAISLILFGVLIYTTFFPLVNKIRTFIANDEDAEVITPNVSVDKEADSTNQATTTEESKVAVSDKQMFNYIEVTGGCGPHFEGECLRVRTGPGAEYPVVARLRNGIVLKVEDKIEKDGISWFKIIFDEWLLYPERVNGDWYVAADHVKTLQDEGDLTIWENDYATNTSKIITVDLSEQMLYASEGEELFLIATTSTGLRLTPTPRGIFKVFKKTPSRYMQGPLPNLVDRSYYDLPGVPWNLYFTDGGAVIHGAYWHTSFGSRYSHGCVNLPPDVAHVLYLWADLGTKVIIKD